ncbi:MAG: hypothetical protein RL272_804, partial [Candidatus Parcubacteria bacterium]
RIDNDAYASACGSYVELNPVRAGLVARPEDWPYSSARCFLGMNEDSLILN